MPDQPIVFVARASALGLLLLLGTAAPGQAHARLAGSEPKDGAVLLQAPTRVRLTFNGLVERHFARFELATGAGKAARLAWDPGRAGRTRVLEIALPPVKAGRHTFLWSVVSADGHRVGGRIAFVVR